MYTPDFINIYIYIYIFIYNVYTRLHKMYATALLINQSINQSINV